ncbi:MAG: hypothetical protein ACSLFC_14900 [Desulfuromonadales bacterium]
MKTSAIVPINNTGTHPPHNPAARAGRRVDSENQHAHSEVALGLVTTFILGWFAGVLIAGYII